MIAAPMLRAAQYVDLYYWLRRKRARVCNIVIMFHHMQNCAYTQFYYYCYRCHRRGCRRRRRRHHRRRSCSATFYNKLNKIFTPYL